MTINELLFSGSALDGIGSKEIPDQVRDDDILVLFDDDHKM